MPTPTPELGLQKGVDADDTADYLTISLANSLGTIDALFNNVSGHTHAGPHQGGPISMASISGPHDIADWFRSTGHATPFPTSGTGLEMYYDATNGGIIDTYNRSTSTWGVVTVSGSVLHLQIGGAGDGITINPDRAVVIPNTLTVNGATTVQGALNSLGNLACTGNLLMTSTNQMQFPHGGVISDYTQASGYVAISNLNCAAAQFTGVVTVNGDFTAQRLFIGTDSTRWLAINGATGVQLVAAGGLTVMNSSGTVTGFAASTGSFTGGVTASAFTTPNSVYTNGCVVNNGTNNAGVYLYVNGPAGGTSGWNVIPSSIRFKTQVAAIAQALALVMDDALHGVHYLVSPEGSDPFEAFGFIAEPWHERAPDLVHELDGQPAGMDYSQIIAIVFEALKQYIARTEPRLSALEGKAA